MPGRVPPEKGRVGLFASSPRPESVRVSGLSAAIPHATVHLPFPHRLHQHPQKWQGFAVIELLVFQS